MSPSPAALTSNLNSGNSSHRLWSPSFVMGGFDPKSQIDAFRAGIWRLKIAADEQGRGYGRFAVAAVAAEARRRGQKRITVL
jgi:GNAT superfamily N-acetyltransferase